MLGWRSLATARISRKNRSKTPGSATMCRPITLRTSSRSHQAVVGEIDDSHTTAAQLADDLVIGVVRQLDREATWATLNDLAYRSSERHIRLQDREPWRLRRLPFSSVAEYNTFLVVFQRSWRRHERAARILSLPWRSPRALGGPHRFACFTTCQSPPTAPARGTRNAPAAAIPARQFSRAATTSSKIATLARLSKLAIERLGHAREMGIPFEDLAELQAAVMLAASRRRARGSGGASARAVRRRPARGPDRRSEPSSRAGGR